MIVDQPKARAERRSMKRFEGKVVLVTGGTSGIGTALAEAFLDDGASVAVCGRNESGLDRFRARHPEALAVAADVTDPSAQHRLIESVVARFGRLDILVNNAGRLVERDFAADRQQGEGLAGEFALNLVAPVQITAAALARCPWLEAIVFMSSGFALVSPRRAPTYGAAKAGLHGFAEGLRRQLATQGTHVLEVLPPVVDTPATAHRKAKKVSPQAVAAATLDALAEHRPSVLIGATRLLPTLLRVAPGATSRLVSEM